ncbi:MAG: hypothetical protein IJ816_01200 [Alloprevotella sp.]|nr:hypothetical protein [Alloprevotella sp.]
MHKSNHLTQLLLGAVAVGLISLSSYSCQSNQSDRQELEDLKKLAEADREELQNQYAEFAHEYEEMKKVVRDDSLLVKLDQEQRRAEQLMKELKATKAADAAEILRLKKELETVRAVLRDYIRQVDSLQQLNIALTGERDAALEDAKQAHLRNEELSSNNAQLRQTVEVASQLNATNVQLVALKKNGKSTKKIKDTKRFSITFNISRNVTAKTGTKEIYVRIMKPNQEVVAPAGTITYENASIQYSAKKTIDYTGEEALLTLFVPISEFLSAGTYSTYIFCEGQMIGSGKTLLQ